MSVWLQYRMSVYPLIYLNTLPILCDVLRQDGISVYPLIPINTLAILSGVLRQDGMSDKISVYT